MHTGSMDPPARNDIRFPIRKVASCEGLYPLQKLPLTLSSSKLQAIISQTDITRHGDR